jgi:hypothetical protein
MSDESITLLIKHGNSITVEKTNTSSIKQILESFASKKALTIKIDEVVNSLLTNYTVKIPARGTTLLEVTFPTSIALLLNNEDALLKLVLTEGFGWTLAYINDKPENFYKKVVSCNGGLICYIKNPTNEVRAMAEKQLGFRVKI